MTNHERERLLAAADNYLEGQRTHIRIDASGHPEVQPPAALLAIVDAGARIRAAARSESTPYEMALRRLTFCTDDVLATILARGDDDADAEIVRAWEDARSELESLR